LRVPPTVRHDRAAPSVQSLENIMRFLRIMPGLDSRVCATVLKLS